MPSFFQPHFATRTSVPNPLGFTSWRYEEPLAVVVGYIDRRRINPPTLASFDLEEIVVRQSDAPTDECAKQVVEEPFDETGPEKYRTGVTHSLLPLSHDRPNRPKRPSIQDGIATIRLEL